MDMINIIYILGAVNMSNDNILHKWWKGSKYEDGVKSMHKGLDSPREKITKMYNKMFGKV